MAHRMRRYNVIYSNMYSNIHVKSVAAVLATKNYVSGWTLLNANILLTIL